MWPERLGPSYSIIKELETTRVNLLPPIPQHSHQADADIRDQAFEQEDQALGIQRPIPYPDNSESGNSSTDKSDGSTDLTDYESNSTDQRLPKITLV